MEDDDGGQSLIAAGIRAVTSADAKQNQLQKELVEVQNRLLQLSRGWVVDPDTNLDREKRLAAAKKVHRLARRRRSRRSTTACTPCRNRCASPTARRCSFPTAATRRAAARGDPLPRQLHNFLHEWATVAVPKRFEAYCNAPQGGRALAGSQRRQRLRPLSSRLSLHGEGVRRVGGRVQPVVNLKTRDEAARRRARRKYVRIILNDYVLNPGPSQAPLPLDEAVAAGRQRSSAEQDFSRFGLMASFVERWAKRLPQALALGAGEHVKLPPGNGALIHILEPYDK